MREWGVGRGEPGTRELKTYKALVSVTGIRSAGLLAGSDQSQRSLCSHRDWEAEAISASVLMITLPGMPFGFLRRSF